jgi:NhaA family Na+:H+ antiporter
VRIGGRLENAGVTVGVLLGLVIGKPLGVTAVALGAVKSGIAQLPRGLGWASLVGCACLAGIGFTMSLFIAMLAFDETGPVNAAKSGILAGSLLAGMAGAIVLRIAVGFRRDE